jgi:hypothetical protein
MINPASLLGVGAWSQTSALDPSAIVQQDEAQLLQAMDANGDGSVSPGEFASWLASAQSQTTSPAGQGATSSTDDIFTQLTEDIGTAVNGLLAVLEQGAQALQSPVGAQAAAGSTGTMSVESLLASYLSISAALQRYGESGPGSILNTTA